MHRSTQHRWTFEDVVRNFVHRQIWRFAGELLLPFFRSGIDPGRLVFRRRGIGDRCTAKSFSSLNSTIPWRENIDESVAARSIFGGLTACSPHVFSIYVLLTTRLQPKLNFLAGLAGRPQEAERSASRR